VNGKIGFRYFDRATLDFGKAIKIKLGDDVIFEGRVMGLTRRFPKARRRASSCWRTTSCRTCG
jgi:hypothetical protein